MGSNTPSRPRREGQDLLDVFVVETELQPDEVVTPIVAQDVVDSAEKPESLDECIGQVDSPPRPDHLTETEEVLNQLEPIVEQDEIETDTSGRFLDAESADHGSHSLRELEAEPERVARGAPNLAVLRRLVHVGGLDGRILDLRASARIVDDLERVILVLLGLESELHELFTVCARN